jgi:threonine/homoserine/homoserine lactone efflux protein
MASQPAAVLSDMAALRTGFLTNALNPKTTVFVVSLFLQIVGRTHLWPRNWRTAGSSRWPMWVGFASWRCAFPRSGFVPGCWPYGTG